MRRANPQFDLATAPNSTIEMIDHDGIIGHPRQRRYQQGQWRQICCSPHTPPYAEAKSVSHSQMKAELCVTAKLTHRCSSWGNSRYTRRVSPNFWRRVITTPCHPTNFPLRTFSGPSAFSRWLAAQPDNSPGAWLKFAKKGAPETTISKSDAIDVALAHGWIDGQLGRLDDFF